MPAETLRLYLLGAFRLLYRDEVVRGFDQARLQELLAYLVLRRGSPIPRQQLAFLLWPDSTEPQSRTNFRNLWHRLRRALPDADSYLTSDDLAVQWRVDAPCWLDVAAFATVFERAEATASVDEQIAALDDAVAGYGGELLPGCYSDWLLAERDRLAQAYGDALAQLATLREERREYRQAIGYTQALLRHDPLREPAYAQLMRLHALNADRAAALRTYHTCATVLRRELDVEPGPATRLLYEQLLNATAQAVVPAQIDAAIPLVGREAEWAQLQRAWQAAAVRPRLALISGEAGIGKTRLAEALAEWVSRQGIPALVARCYAASGDLAYAPVISWLRSRPLPPLARPWLRELSRLLPEILVEHPDLPPPEPLTERWQRLHLFEAMARAVLTGHSTLLLFLDDLQWCDRDTLDWLHYLLTARLDLSTRARLLVVATWRSEAGEADEAVAAWLVAGRAELARADQVTELELGPLSEAASLALANRVAGRPFDRELGPLLYQGTEGNPLFIVEMVRAGVSRNASSPLRHAAQMEANALPDRVRQVLDARLAQLSPAARSVIELAAVVGRAFTYGVLAHATDLSEDQLVGSLDECWRKRIIREQGEDAYDFSHDKLREAAYAGLSRARRRWLHGRVAQALEQTHEPDLDAVSGQIAAQLERAGKPAAAIVFYRQAATAAQRIYSNDEAIRLYQHLLQSELRRSLSALDTCAVKLALGEIYRVTGHWSQAETASREALGLAETLGDAALQARAQRALADALRLKGHYESALEWLVRAEKGFETIGDWRGVVSTLWTIGEVYWFKGDHKRALSALERQLQIATEIDDQRGICEALDTMGMVYWSQGDWDQSVDCCLRSIAVAEPLGYHLVITRAAITVGNVYAAQHFADDAASWYLRAGRLAHQIDDRQVYSWAIANIAGILAERGFHLEALMGHVRATEIALETGDRWTACLNIAYIGEVLERLGEANQAEFLYRKAIDYGRALGTAGFLSSMLIDLSRLLLDQNQAPEARLFYDEAMEVLASVTGERLGGEDTRFEAQLLGIRLRHTLEPLTQAVAVSELKTLLEQTSDPGRRAVICYEIWRLIPNERARIAAADLNRTQYALTGAHEYRQRFLQLTGETLPDPPSLPDVSELIPAEPLGYVELMRRVKQMLAELDALFA